MLPNFKSQRLLAILVCLLLVHGMPVATVRAQDGATIPSPVSVSSTPVSSLRAEASEGFVQTADAPQAPLGARLLSDIKAVIAGERHTCALTVSGGVKCWGENTSGEVGDGTDEPRRAPVDVVGLATNIQAISAGQYHTCALTASGGVKCWGSNSDGQLGDSTYETRLTPVNVVGLGSGVRAITTGDSHTCALMTTGGVKCWGYNSLGQVGDGTDETRRTPVNVVGLGGIRAISAGQHHTCALSTSGGVKCWGWNSHGQLGNGMNQNSMPPVDVVGLGSGVQAISAGQYHSCALLTTGEGKCWGSNYGGELGDGTTEPHWIPGAGIRLGGAVQEVSAGSEYTCALTVAGGVKCWGNNGGRLGDGTDDSRLTPVDVVGLSSGVRAIITSVSHTCALMLSGGVKCWGYRGRGQLGDSSWRSHWTPVDVLADEPDVVADNGFHLIPDGFKFANWGGYDYPLGIDLNRQDMFDMFGPGVCSSGATADTCILDPMAQFWRQVMWKHMEGGHCAGMALGSQRIWAGYDSTESLEHVLITYDLSPSNEVRAYIARNFVLQYLTPLGTNNSWRVQYGDGTTPNQVLELIRDNLRNNPKDPYYLGIRHAAGKGGHAVTPYQIDDVGNGIFRVFIYDNNWPRAVRYIVFDTSNNSWEYEFGANEPGAPKDTWSGNAFTQTLRLRLTSGTQVARWQCYFCRPRAESAETAQGNGRLLFNAEGESSLTVSSSTGERIGWDQTRGMYVNEVAGGVLHYTDGGSGFEIPAMVELPTGEYEAVIANQTAESQQGGVNVLGEGFAMGSQGLVLAPSAAQHYTIGADERMIRFEDAARNSPPALFLLDDTGSSSYRFDITLNALAQGGEVELSYDPLSGRVQFSDTDAATNRYAVSVIRTNPDGITKLFYNPAVEVPDTSIATADLGAWDGEGALPVTVGETTKMIPNRSNTWLPTILR